MRKKSNNKLDLLQSSHKQDQFFSCQINGINGYTFVKLLMFLTLIGQRMPQQPKYSSIANAQMHSNRIKDVKYGWSQGWTPMGQR